MTNNTQPTDPIAVRLAADLFLTIFTPDAVREADDVDLANMIHECRDDFASSDDDRLADMRLLPPFSDDVHDEIRRRTR